PEVSCEVICDGFHLHPAILKLLMRVKPIDRIVMVTDSLKPTGQKNGPLMANNEEVFLEDGVFKRKSDHAIAGSALTMINGVKTLHELGFPMENILRMANSNPAAVLLRNQQIGNLIPGRDADIVVFDKDFQIQMVFVKGVIKKLFE
ncbi:MAG: amidohydrolase family protein, partial [Candidatus Delongbacteria bacterium]|nr:amidohydrolase family protein [Candidatus Delongbacteria bacterium]